ncbi:dihydrofolate reductase [Lentibacillus sp. Marseille-P4043]|uniref:dihydrofolate reductase n=1 Tax=Lentibacillus sp. Marseille-P4043 TaxID=2040293 RepID=UPI000D0B4912|nr:dihydrofolate reductase [Lentibacillus sp. Marseille-P4043]
MISLLVAMSHNQVIGSDKDLPWHLPNDLKFFKELTTDHTIIMGRKTFESIGKALPKRKNIVITKQDPSKFPEGVHVIHDLDTVAKWKEETPDEEIFIIGGGTIFEELIDIADRMYITFIDHSFEGDTHFPIFTMEDWSLTSKAQGEKNEKNPYDYYFLQYDRR